MHPIDAKKILREEFEDEPLGSIVVFTGWPGDSRWSHKAPGVWVQLADDGSSDL